MIELIAVTLIACSDLRVVDGDTIKCNGQNMRLLGDGEPFVSGVDAAEIRRAKCEQEKRLGQDAKKRLQQLMKTPGIMIEDSRAVDRTGRPLIRVRLPNGKTAGQTLIDEGYAVVWTPGYKRTWCS
ncbi:thermonuclease family protein [Mesorhizobium marinum]|uniref:thermonuclease family protein n=1 Tax=Mesorhizobium marinum TaxID=3228790 RepID=UPI00346565E6